jgi:hypothetical protein
MIVDKLDIFIGLLVVFIGMLISSSSTRMFYNATKDQVAPRGIRITQYLSFLGVILTILCIIFA